MFKSFKVDNARRVEFEDKFIQIPKSKWAYLRNNIDTFHSTGGEGTPSEQIPIVNIAEWNNTVYGKNWFNKNDTDVATGYYINAITAGAQIIGEPYYGGGAYAMTGWISVVPNKQITVSGGFFGGVVAGLCFYDITKTVISGLRQFSGNYTFTTPANCYFIRGSINTETGSLDTAQLELGSAATADKAYSGSVYSYRLEDTDGNLHYGGDLPDGTADTYNRETGQFVEKVLKYTLNNTAEILGVYNVYSKPNSEVFYIRSTLFGSYSSPLITFAAVRCTHFIYDPNIFDQDIQGCYANPSVNPPVIACRINDSVTGIVKTDTEAEKLTKVRSWLTGQINASTPPVFLIGLTTPQTYTIKQYGETYGGVVWEYNEKPIQVEDSVCNVFSDKNVKMKFKAVSY